MTGILIVFVTAESREQAETLAEKVVAEKLAACVNIVPGVRSCYVWEGKLTWSEEVLLVMKTTREGFAGLEKRVRELHSYEVPEILGVEVEAGSERYLEWVSSGVGRGPGEF
jgi:periplasmic divalent cation tolerance protein